MSHRQKVRPQSLHFNLKKGGEVGQAIGLSKNPSVIQRDPGHKIIVSDISI
jgi:hypothetical protein